MPLSTMFMILKTLKLNLCNTTRKIVLTELTRLVKF